MTNYTRTHLNCQFQKTGMILIATYAFTNPSSGLTNPSSATRTFCPASRILRLASRTLRRDIRVPFQPANNLFKICSQPFGSQVRTHLKLAIHERSPPHHLERVTPKPAVNSKIR
ncbi:hypothetical protein AVEN_9674-1 [Araneus ventricosus]|uniref:Uncharacterized protein n=1 Tax=Araneus ventricosus TaxID=182803 RepID=A0A4Y2KIF4_ARAVE|nr:hypothetical protein AVEN_9674-1 [Araneus ventricosus]